MNSIHVAILALAICASGASVLQASDPAPRPAIVCISHIALYVHDIEKSRAFYRDFLGFAEPYSLPNADGTLHLTWIKINDQQTIELFPEKQAGSDRLYHIALETDDAEGMRNYLASRGVEVPDRVPTGKIGNRNYFIKDPDGHSVEIVQYMPGGWTEANKGKFLPETRIATRMPHVGILVGDLDGSQKFFGDILGFREIWRGAKKADLLSWVHEQVPEGKDFIELMLYSDLPDPDKRGRFHHLCLEVPDIESTKSILQERAGRIGYSKPLVLVGKKMEWTPLLSCHIDSG